MCQNSKIVLRTRHIPGRMNVLAAVLSRPTQMSGTEWSLHPSVFQAVIREWGIPLLDLFATRWNHKLSVFVFPVPDSVCTINELEGNVNVGIEVTLRVGLSFM